MNEEWRAIPGYEGWYEASSDGRIRSVRTFNGRAAGKVRAKVLAPLLYRKGYLKIQLGSCANTVKRKRDFVHRVIYRTFHGPIPKGLTINHKDNDKANNRPTNLELATHQEQVTHAKQFKTRQGPRPTPSPLTAEIVREIRRVLAETPPPTYQARLALAAQYDVSPSTIRFIERRTIWKHV